MGSIGDVYVDIGARTTALGRGLERAKAMLNGFAKSKGAQGASQGAIQGTSQGGGGVGGMAAGLLGGAKIGAGMKAFEIAKNSVMAVGSAIAQSSQMGADLNETMSKTGVLLGGASQDAVKFAQALQEGGQGQMKDILESITGSAMAMKGMGMETGKAIEMAKALEERVGDVGSQDNIDPKQIREDIQSAFSGELQVMRKYKVFMDMDSLKKTGLPLGEAIAQGIMEQTARAKGDFARTRLSTANMGRTNTNMIESMMTRFGQAIQPVSQAFAYLKSVILQAISGMSVDGFTGLITQIQGVLIDMADGLAIAVVNVIIPMGQALITVGGWFLSVVGAVGGFFRDAIVAFGGFQGVFARMGLELAYRLAQEIDLLIQPFRWVAKQLGITLGEGMSSIVESLGQQREAADREAGARLAEANAKRDADKAALMAALKVELPTEGKGALGEMKDKPLTTNEEKDKGPKRMGFASLLNNAKADKDKQLELMKQIAENTKKVQVAGAVEVATKKAGPDRTPQLVGA